jgi:hypothetical protein
MKFASSYGVASLILFDYTQMHMRTHKIQRAPCLT